MLVVLFGVGVGLVLVALLVLCVAGALVCFFTDDAAPAFVQLSPVLKCCYVVGYGRCLVLLFCLSYRSTFGLLLRLVHGGNQNDWLACRSKIRLAFAFPVFTVSEPRYIGHRRD